MPKGRSRVDVEILQVQVRLGSNRNSALTTMVLERDGLGGGWRLRESLAGAAKHQPQGKGLPVGIGKPSTATIGGCRGGGPELNIP